MTMGHNDQREGDFVYEGKQETHTHTMKRIHPFDCQGCEKNWSSSCSVCVRVSVCVSVIVLLP